MSSAKLQTPDLFPPPTLPSKLNLRLPNVVTIHTVPPVSAPINLPKQVPNEVPHFFIPPPIPTADVEPIPASLTQTLAPRPRGRPKKYQSEDEAEREKLARKVWLENNPEYNEILKTKMRMYNEQRKIKKDIEKNVLTFKSAEEVIDFMDKFAYDGPSYYPDVIFYYDMRKIMEFLKDKKIRY